MGKGFSVDNLELMRKFYTGYSKIQHVMPVKSLEIPISETLSRISAKNSETSSRKTNRGNFLSKKTWEALTSSFSLSWSHYVVLLTIKSEDERKFYELEDIQKFWGIRELKRQINSSLYERLALSRDKKKVKELSEKAAGGSPRGVGG